MTVPIATSPGRGGFGPQLGLSYDSGSGNGLFGFRVGNPILAGESHGKLTRGLPRVTKTSMIPTSLFCLARKTWCRNLGRTHCGQWVKDSRNNFVRNEFDYGPYRIRSYRPRIEGLFARLERWTNRV